MVVERKTHLLGLTGWWSKPALRDHANVRQGGRDASSEADPNRKVELVRKSCVIDRVRFVKEEHEVNRKPPRGP